MRQRTTLNRITPLFAVLCLAGCGHQAPPAKPIDVRPRVRLVAPESRTIARTVGQPGFIYAYEQTAIFPKVAGYLEKWNVDIGDPIKRNQEIATLSVPELDAELQQKKAQVQLDEAQITVAERMVEVASSNVKAATAQIQEAKANVTKAQAGIERWESEVKRLTELVNKEGVVDKQVLSESRKQLNIETASREAAKASVTVGEANELARRADLDKARADVVAARAKAQASRADEQRVAALVSYTHITAPYDGIVVTRNANTRDYVQPGSGDQSVTSPNSAHAPLYVVARTDKVRVYVDVPEVDAPMVKAGTKASVRIQALGDEQIDAAVTRTSWALRRETRTLQAEIDLPNPNKRLLPGMYAYGRVRIERRNARAVPLAAVVEIGNQNCCYLYEDGKAVQTPVQTGIHDGEWVEVTKKRAQGEWTAFTGEEKVILGDLSELTDGLPVRLEEGNSKQPR